MKKSIFREGLPGAPGRQLQSAGNEILHTNPVAPSLVIDGGASDELGLEPGGGDDSAVQIVDALVSLAVNREASDLHLDPTEHGLRARLRVDGVLSDLRSYDRETAPLIVSRLKILAGMNIAERRLPQDGNIAVEWNDRQVNIRLSTLPTIYGEKVVARLFRPGKIVIPLDSLGFNPENYRNYREFLRPTHGFVLLTGPAGCGKTTTLYSTLHHLNNPGYNIITIEDPVEYRLKGINQIQVNEKINLTFARALRHILRQDPNMIMIGEIRDDETAEIATRAALTGHQVFSTLHTNDAPGAVTRLLDMGVKPFLLNSALTGVVAQRLIRLTCHDCRENIRRGKKSWPFMKTFAPAPRMISFLPGVRGAKNVTVPVSGGARPFTRLCRWIGRLRKLIHSAKGTEELRHHAISRGMQPLLQDGLNRVREGLTTLKEIMRVAYTVA